MAGGSPGASTRPLGENREPPGRCYCTETLLRGGKFLRRNEPLVNARGEQGALCAAVTEDCSGCLLHARPLIHSRPERPQ